MSRSARCSVGPEVNDLLAALEGTRVWLATFLAVHTGMRPGEALALSWDDVDLVRGTVHVGHTMHPNRDCCLDIGPAKNTTSVRTLAIPPVVVEVLREVQQQRMPERVSGLWPKPSSEGHLEYIVCTGGLPSGVCATRRMARFSVHGRVAQAEFNGPILRRAGLRQSPSA